MGKTYFIAGTDTDVGKTLAGCAILTAAGQAGFSTAAVKPLAAGTVAGPEGIHNADAIMLKRCCTMELSVSEINPVCFDDAIAPHIAAQRRNVLVQVRELAAACRAVMDRQADLTLIEGAGGWRVPVNRDETLAHLVKLLGIPVILVVGVRLGCINHALLSAEAIKADGVTLAGWVANRIDAKMEAYAENLATLERRLAVPLLGEIPFLEAGDRSAMAAGHIHLDNILERAG